MKKLFFALGILLVTLSAFESDLRFKVKEMTVHTLVDDEWEIVYDKEEVFGIFVITDSRLYLHTNENEWYYDLISEVAADTLDNIYVSTANYLDHDGNRPIISIQIPAEYTGKVEVLMLYEKLKIFYLMEDMFL